MFLFKPDERRIAAFLETEKTLPFSYIAVKNTLSDVPVAGFDNDLNTQVLGEGEQVWAAAKAAIRAWKMFPGGWACIHPAQPSIQEGTVVAMLARVLGIWWMNSCRIVYTLDETNRFGFAYGTLPGHAECGEELFSVEKDASGVVTYRLKAFSRPRHPLARLAYPIARLYQRKFVRASKQSMLQFVNTHQA